MSLSLMDQRAVCQDPEFSNPTRIQETFNLTPLGIKHYPEGFIGVITDTTVMVEGDAGQTLGILVLPLTKLESRYFTLDTITHEFLTTDCHW